MEELLDAAGVARRSVAVAGALRMNVSVLEPDGTTTKLNEPGPRAQPGRGRRPARRHPPRRRRRRLGRRLRQPAARRPHRPLRALVTRVRERGIRVAVDSSGTPMTAAVAARPNLIKPNHEELAELVGHPLPTLRDVHAAARDLVADGIEVVAVSLGGDGALLVTADELVHARATITAPLSTVGAGDCMLAGLLHGLSTGLSAADALAGAVTWGAAAVTLPGSRVPAPARPRRHPRRGRRHTPDPSLVLR